MSTVLWDLLSARSPEMWTQYLQNLSTEVLEVERVSRMPRVSHCVGPREASYQFAAKDSCRGISTATEQQGSRSLFFSQRAVDFVLPER